MVSSWDAGDINAAGATLPTKVYYPSPPGSLSPVVAVIHGAGRTGANMAVLAETLASRGLVAVVPTIPCGPFTGCDHDANAAQVSAIIEWAVLESQDPLAPLFGRVDGARRGVIGHSFGGLAILLAAARDPRIGSLVLLDPNDDLGGPAQAEAASVAAPSMHLVAETLGVCNSSGWRGNVYPLTAPPHLRARVLRSGHCDPEEPTGGLCPSVCGSGDHSTTTIFRRYAVAWTSCVLQSDPAMSGYVGGPSLALDVTSGVLDSLDHAGLERLPCRTQQPSTDAGGGVLHGDGGDGTPLDAEPDASATSMRDAETLSEISRDGGEKDASTSTSGIDPASTRGDAGDESPADPEPAGSLGLENARDGEHCSCAAARQAHDLDRAEMLVAAIVVVLARRSRRRMSLA